MHPLRLLSALLILLTLFAASGQDSGAQPLKAAAQSEIWREQQRHDKEVRERMERAAAKNWNKERHESLAKDTEKLLQLATELKAHVQKSNENTMSLEVMKKAEEIEKLAKKVREKMKGH